MHNNILAPYVIIGLAILLLVQCSSSKKRDFEFADKFEGKWRTESGEVFSCKFSNGSYQAYLNDKLAPSFYYRVDKENQQLTIRKIGESEYSDWWIILALTTDENELILTTNEGQQTTLRTLNSRESVNHSSNTSTKDPSEKNGFINFITLLASLATIFAACWGVYVYRQRQKS